MGVSNPSPLLLSMVKQVLVFWWTEAEHMWVDYNTQIVVIEFELLAFSLTKLSYAAVA